MKVLIASEGPNLSDKVADKLITAPFFIIINSETNNYNVIENKNKNDFSIIDKAINEENVQAFVASSVGPKTFDKICGLNRKTVLAKNRQISEAYKMVLHGELKILECPTIKEDIEEKELQS